MSNKLRWVVGISSATLLLLAIAYFAGFHWFLFAIIFLFIMIFHEFGHFWFAKRNGIKTTEFGIGFGPRLWHAKIKEMVCSFRLLPLGAFVSIHGMYNTEDIPKNIKEKETYRNASFTSKIKVIAAGPFTHFISAFLIFILLFSIIGYSGYRDDNAKYSIHVNEVIKDGVLYNVGIIEGDQIISINNHSVNNASELKDKLKFGDNTMQIKRKQEFIDKEFVLNDEKKLNIIISRKIKKENITNSLYYSSVQLGYSSYLITKNIFVEFPKRIFKATKNINHVFDGDTATDEDTIKNDRILGVVGFSNIVASSLDDNTEHALVNIAQISILLGLFNLIPLLPFDGGHIAVATYERIRQRKNSLYRVNPTKFSIIGFLVLVVLIIVSLVALTNDIINPLQI